HCPGTAHRIIQLCRRRTLAPTTRQKYFSISENSRRAEAVERRRAAGGFPGAGGRIVNFSARQKTAPDAARDEDRAVGQKVGIGAMAPGGHGAGDTKCKWCRCQRNL